MSEHNHLKNECIEESKSHTHESHAHSLREELMCHFPYAAFSVACGFVILSLLHFIGLTFTDTRLMNQGYHILFHSFHFLHMVFAVTGTLVTFSRFSQNVVRGIIVSLVSASVFCTISDVALPYLAGELLGVEMHIHICFFGELWNVIPFLLVGLLNGLFLRRHYESSLGFFSLGSHFVHILISSLASLFYTVSYGFENWYNVMGLLFFFLIIAVVIPCTLSDVVVPMYFARFRCKK